MAFQTKIGDHATWQLEIKETPGILAIIDCHQNWCGPCKAIQSTFKRIFFDYGDKPMKFYTADVSKIEALASMVGSSEPNFVFYMDGEKLGDTIKGCNSPVLSDIIYKKLGIEG